MLDSSGITAKDLANKLPCDRYFINACESVGFAKQLVDSRERHHRGSNREIRPMVTAFAYQDAVFDGEAIDASSIVYSSIAAALTAGEPVDSHSAAASDSLSAASSSASSSTAASLSAASACAPKPLSTIFRESCEGAIEQLKLRPQTEEYPSGRPVVVTGR
jgi:hypothetical protein